MAFSYGEITSRKNDKIIWACRLHDKKRRDAEGLFFTEGVKLLEEATQAQLKAKTIFFTGKAYSLYLDTLEKADAEEYILVSDEVFCKLTCEEAPQGIFAVIRKPEPYIPSDKSISEGGFIILDDIQNPLNLGAVFRCAFSLGSRKLILSKGCADVYNPKSLRSAMGSIFKSQFFICDDICSVIDRLKACGNRIFCSHLHSDAHKLGEFDFLKSDSVVIGNEGHGVCDRVLGACTDSVIIPMSDGAESLNAATASAIMIWEMNKANRFSK